MLADPQPTASDLEFDLAGIRVRVSVWFWLAAALLGWGACQALAGGDQRAILQFLVVWIAAVLGSLLVHELGHALAYRWFGMDSRVVLYHFGGLTIPETWGRRHLRPWHRVVVSAAGPLAQLAVAFVLAGAVHAAGYFVPFPLVRIGGALGLYEGRDIESVFMTAFLQFLLTINVFWPLLNLLPVPPLDGGQIVRDGLLAAGVADAQRISAVVGVVVGAAMAWWGYAGGQPYLGIMFAMLAASCFQSLSAGSPPWRRWN